VHSSSSTIHVRISSMSSSKPVYLVNSWKGRVVTQHEKNYPSGVVLEHAGFKGDEQKWIPEFGDEPDTVALKSVSNGKYMHAIGEQYKIAGTGEKTWWKMSYDEVRIPGAFRLSVAGYPEAIVLETQSWDGTEVKLAMSRWKVCSLLHLPSLAHALC
jgi:hypothetical protein